MINIKKTMGIYCRVASPKQRSFLLEAQMKEGVEKAKKLGHEYKLFVEEGSSASIDHWGNQQQLYELLEACETGEISCVFCTDTTRLSRSVLSMAMIKSIFKRHNILLYTTEAVINFKDPEQEFIAELLALLSKRANSVKSIRSRRALEIAARSGKWIGAVLPYGYQLNENRIMVVNEDAAEIVRRIYREFINGSGTRAIAEGLNEDGIPARGRSAYKRKITTVNNKYTNGCLEVKGKSCLFNPGRIYSILTNPIYKGERRYKGSVISSPVIIDTLMWGMAQDKLKTS